MFGLVGSSVPLQREFIYGFLECKLNVLVFTGCSGAIIRVEIVVQHSVAECGQSVTIFAVELIVVAIRCYCVCYGVAIGVEHSELSEYKVAKTICLIRLVGLYDCETYSFGLCVEVV